MPAAAPPNPYTQSQLVAPYHAPVRQPTNPYAPGGAQAAPPQYAGGSASPYYGPTSGSAAGSATGGQNGAGGGTGFALGGYQQTPYSYNQDAGDRNIGTANLGAVSALGNWLNQPGLDPSVAAQRAGYLNSMGIMPTYNGVALNQMGLGGQQQWSQGGAGGNTGGDGTGIDYGRVQAQYLAQGAGGQLYDYAGNPLQQGQRDPFGRTQQAQSTPGGTNLLGAIAASRGGQLNLSTGWSGPPGASSTPTAPGASSGLGGQIGDAYGAMIANDGSPFSDSERARIAQGSADAVNRSTADAIQQARQSASRRGDTSGASVADLEGRLTQGGAALADQARFGSTAAMAQMAQQGQLAALSGAGGYTLGQQQLGLGYGNLGLGYGQLQATRERDQGQLQLLQQELAQQSGGMPIQFMLGGGR